MPDTYVAPEIVDQTKHCANPPISTTSELAQAPSPVHLSPHALVRGICDAMRPLINQKTRELVAGCDTPQIVAALAPIMERYTVADAAYLRSALDAATWCASGADAAALEIVGGELEDFICSAQASSWECAVARAQILRYGKRLRTIPERKCKLLAKALANDIDDMRNGVFYGYLFGGMDDNKDNPFVEKPWWEHLIDDLKFMDCSN